MTDVQEHPSSLGAKVMAERVVIDAPLLLGCTAEELLAGLDLMTTSVCEGPQQRDPR